LRPVAHGQVQFKEQHGHLSVSTDKTSCFYVRALGGWVNAQACRMALAV
jgi:hypothetical protein